MKHVNINKTQAELLNGLKPWLKLMRLGSIEMARLIGETPRGAKLLSAMFAVMDDENSIVATHDVLADLAEMPKRTVQRAVKDLTDRNLIEVLQIQQRGAAHVYRINDRVVWSGRGPDGRAVIKARVFLRGEYQTNPDAIGKAPALPKIDPRALGSFHSVTRPEGIEDPHLTLDQLDLEDLFKGDE